MQVNGAVQGGNEGDLPERRDAIGHRGRVEQTAWVRKSCRCVERSGDGALHELDQKRARRG